MTYTGNDVDVKGINTQLKTQQEQLLPPFDLETRNVSQIFPLEKIVLPSLASSLAAEAKDISEADDKIRKQWNIENKYPRFIMDRLVYLPTDNLEAVGIATTSAKRRRRSVNSNVVPLSRTRMATTLALIGHMFKLAKLKPRLLQQRVPLPNTPQPVAKHLLAHFTILMSKEAGERFKIRQARSEFAQWEKPKKFYLIVLVFLFQSDDSDTS